MRNKIPRINAEKNKYKRQLDSVLTPFEPVFSFVQFVLSPATQLLLTSCWRGPDLFNFFLTYSSLAFCNICKSRARRHTPPPQIPTRQHHMLAPLRQNRVKSPFTCFVWFHTAQPTLAGSGSRSALPNFCFACCIAELYVSVISLTSTFPMYVIPIAMIGTAGLESGIGARIEP